MIQPTHFIEQYNKTPEWKEYSDKDYAHHGPFPIEHLDKAIDDTKKLQTIQTVAIFKIQLKEKAC